MGQNNTTQRAYTLRLKGLNKNDPSWRENLWKTHEAVNRGVQAFGDWLLTMRGGVCHTLVNPEIPQGTNNDSTDKPSKQPTDEAKKNRRILLALSWLSVESARGAPDQKFHIAKENLPETLKKILTKRGLSEEECEQWCKDCKDSLSANIRNDAVWVNRSDMFDEFVSEFKNENNEEFDRGKVWDLLGRFFGDEGKYLAPYKSKKK